MKKRRLFMNSLLIITLFSVLILAVFFEKCCQTMASENSPASVSEKKNEKHPNIYLKGFPAYGGFEDVEGIVCYKDGSMADPSKYHIAVFIYVIGRYWPKPYDATPYVCFDENGYFKADVTTGGVDETATSIYLYLVDSDYEKGDLEYAQNNCYDSVRIDRTAAGDIKVTPKNRAKIESNSRKSTITVSSERVGVIVDFFITDFESLSRAHAKSHLKEAAKYADTVMFRKASGEWYKVYGIANKLGMKVIGTASVSTDEKDSKRELNALIRLCNKGYVSVACIGYMEINSNHIDEHRLVKYIKYARKRIKDKSIPVTTAENLDVLARSAYVRNNCDILLARFGGYTYKNNYDITKATEYFDAQVQQCLQMILEKEVIVLDTGWPTSLLGNGPTEENETDNKENAVRYFKEIWEYSQKNNVKVMLPSWLETSIHTGLCMYGQIKVKPEYAELFK